MSALRRLREELRASWRILVHELSAFSVVGTFNFGVDVAVFNLCTLVLGMDALVSKALATAVSATSAYFMHRHWSFSHRARTGFRREYSLFFLFNALALVIGLVVIAVVQNGFDRTDALALNIANLVAIAAGSGFRFWVYKRYVFPRHPTAPQPATISA